MNILGPRRKISHGDSSKWGYANNFGQPVNRSHRSVESILIDHILKPLVTKFEEFGKELHNHENIVCIFYILEISK